MLKQLPFNSLPTDKSRYRDKKVVFLARNLKDIIVSAYFQATKRVNLFDKGISEFIRTDEFGIKKILTFYNHWFASSTVPEEFLLITYEDMHVDPGLILRHVLEFSGLENVQDVAIHQAVDYCAFENMKKMERQNMLGDPRMAPSNIQDADSYKVRKGKVGNYSEYLSSEDLSYIDSVIDEMACARLKQFSSLLQ
jgi:hypothetical protein